MPRFVTLESLEKFNSSVKRNVLMESTGDDKPVVQFDPNEFDSFIVAPEKLDDQALYSIADLFDGKVSSESFDYTPSIDQKSPNTIDKINDSVAVAYITKDGIPVAACTLRDPTEENYQGIISNDYYEMKSGVSLENRLEQEFFEVHPDFHDLGLAQELRSLVSTVVDATFTVIPSSSQDKATGLASGGFELASEFNVDWSDVPVQLWII